jgi:hypothetical protein
LAGSLEPASPPSAPASATPPCGCEGGGTEGLPLEGGGGGGAVSSPQPAAASGAATSTATTHNQPRTCRRRLEVFTWYPDPCR